MKKVNHSDGDDHVMAVIEGVRLPLQNVEVTIEQYLMMNGNRLDTETRKLLAGVRDCVSRVAGSTRTLNVGPPSHV